MDGEMSDQTVDCVDGEQSVWPVDIERVDAQHVAGERSGRIAQGGAGGSGADERVDAQHIDGEMSGWTAQGGAVGGSVDERVDAQHVDDGGMSGRSEMFDFDELKPIARGSDAVQGSSTDKGVDAQHI